MDVEKVSEGPPVDVEVGQVGLAVLGGADELHGCSLKLIDDFLFIGTILEKDLNKKI